MIESEQSIEVNMGMGGQKWQKTVNVDLAKIQHKSKESLVLLKGHQILNFSYGPEIYNEENNRRIASSLVFVMD